MSAADAPDYGTPDSFSYPPGTSLLNFQRNAGVTVAEPGLDLEDSATVAWSLVDDPANSRVKVSATATVAYPVTSVFGRAGAVVAAAGDYTAAQVTLAADKGASATQTFAGPVSVGGPLTGHANDPAGAALFLSGLFQSASTVPGQIVLATSVAGDAQFRFTLDTAGKHLWATDTTLERSAANTLQLTNTGLRSTSPTVGVGYGAGAGAAVAQLTSRTTAVQINNVCGRITTNATSLATGATAAFVVNNTTVAATDAIVLNLTNAGAFTPLNFPYAIMAVAAGSFTVAYTNNTGAATVTAFVFNFAVVKAVNA